MKNNFFALVKINLKNMFSSLTMSGSKKMKKGIIFLFGLLGAYLLGFGFYMAWTMANKMPTEGLSTLIFIGFLFSFLILLINTIFSANLYIFKAKDFDTLITLPIKKSIIVISKFVSLLLLCYIYAFFTFTPFALVYFIKIFNIWSLLLTIFGFLIFPCFAIFIGFVLSFLINIISKYFKYSNIIVIILSLILAGGMVYINTNFNTLFTAFITNSESTMSILNVIFFPIFFITRAITALNLLSFLYYILLSTIPLMLVLMFIVKYFVKLNTMMQSSIKIKKFEYNKVKSGSLKKALLKKEFKRLFSSPNYFLNSCMTTIVILLISVVTIFYDIFGLSEIPTKNDLFATLFLLGGMMLMLANPLTATFSLEGKSFWQIKTLPLTFKQIASAKFNAYLILYIPAAIIAAICLGIGYAFDFKAIILLAGLFTLCVILAGLIAMLINLKNNNIHFTNEIVVIKQSIGVLFNMLISLAITISIFFIYIFLLIKVVDFYFYFALIAIALIGGIYLCYKKLLKNGEKLFNAIE